MSVTYKIMKNGTVQVLKGRQFAVVNPKTGQQVAGTFYATKEQIAEALRIFFFQQN